MRHNRQSIRLKTWDYSQSGYYFVTICTQNRECIFGKINAGKMKLNKYGEILNKVINLLPDRFNVNTDIFQIMPNHLHIIIIATKRWHRIRAVGAIHESPIHGSPIHGSDTIDQHLDVVRAHRDVFRAHRDVPLQKRSLLSQIIGYLKMNTSKSIHQINPNLHVWQRNYYERIIRNEREFENTRRYIIQNPLDWASDKNNPINF